MEDNGAVLFLVDAQSPARMLPGSLTGFGLLVDSPPAANNPFYVHGGAGSAHRDETRLRFRGGHSRQRAHLRVGELPTLQRFRQSRQRSQRPCDPYPFASSAGGKSHSPAEPMCTREKPAVPTATSVELADESEQACGGRVEVGRQLGDFVAQPVQLLDARWRFEKRERFCRHDVASFGCPDSNPSFSEGLTRPTPKSSRAPNDFRSAGPTERGGADICASSPAFLEGCGSSEMSPGRTCQAETGREPDTVTLSGRGERGERWRHF